MILNFPQWQGEGFPSTVDEGAKRLGALIQNQAAVHHVPVAAKHSLTIEDGIFGRTEIEAQLKSALDILNIHEPKRVLTIGGDCGIEVAPSAYLNNLYGGDVQIFWIDAHSDINTPDTSFSGHFHGMPLAYLLGEAVGDAITNLIPKFITPDQIAYLGLRSIDPPEEEYIANHNIKNLGWDSVRDMPKKYSRAILHVDTDVLDESIYRECSTPTSGGTTLETLLATLDYLWSTYDVVGATITEYAPKGADAARTLVSQILKTGLRANDAMWA
ncbi:MAG: arginase family protein [Proteobacteria bacterium]|nr:arginase family protein [Pseudomonadota bacterium]